MMKVTLGLVLLAAVWVSGNPHGNSKEDSSENCASTDKTCICHELLEPTTRPSKSDMKTITSTCATQLGVTLPSRHSGRGKRSPHGSHAPLSNEMRNCIDLAVMKNNNLLDATGKIDATAATTYYTTLINANKVQATTVTDAQVQTIIGSVSTCATQGNAATLIANTFNDCLNAACVAAV